MKKILTIGLVFGSLLFGANLGEAKAASNNAPASAEVLDPQYRGQVWQQRDRRGRQRQVRQRGVRTYTTTRVVRIGRQYYRETIRVTQLPNGRTQSRVISRVPIGRR